MHARSRSDTSPKKFYLAEFSSGSESGSASESEVRTAPPSKKLRVTNPDLPPLSIAAAVRPATSTMGPSLAAPRRVRPPEAWPLPRHIEHAHPIGSHGAKPSPLRPQATAGLGALLGPMGHYVRSGLPFFFFTNTDTSEVSCANTLLDGHSMHRYFRLPYPEALLSPRLLQVSYVHPSSQQTVHLGFLSQLLDQRVAAALMPCLTAISSMGVDEDSDERLLAVAVAAACFDLGLLVGQDEAIAANLRAQLTRRGKTQADNLGLHYAVRKHLPALVGYFFDRGAEPRFVEDKSHASAFTLALQPPRSRYLPMLLQRFTSLRDAAYLLDHLDHNGVHLGTNTYTLLTDRIMAIRAAAAAATAAAEAAASSNPAAIGQ